MDVRVVWLLALMGFPASAASARDTEVARLDRELVELAAKDSWQLPAQCPVGATTHVELIAKLKLVAKGLRAGKCSGKATELVKGIGDMVFHLNNAYQLRQKHQAGELADYQGSLLDPDGAGVETELAERNTVLAERSSELMGNLMSVSKEKECVEDIRDRSLLAVFGDIASKVGQMAMVVPSGTGVLVGSTSLLVGSSLKVVSSLFQSNFDWEKEAHRRQFLDLNCSFLEIRREMANLGFFGLEDEELPAEIARLKGLQQRVEAQIKGLHQAVRSTSKRELAGHNEHLDESIGKDNRELWERVQRLAQTLAKSTSSEAGRTGFAQLSAVAEEGSRVAQLLEGSGLELERHVHFRSLLAEVVPEAIAQLLERKEEELLRVYLVPLEYYFRKLQEELGKRIAKEPSYQVPKPLGEEKKLLKRQLERWQGHAAMLQKRLALLETRQRADVGESTQAYDVLREYHQIRDLVYGRQGWSFLKFLTKDMKKQRHKFKEAYQTWREVADAQDLELACGNAHQGGLYWDRAAHAELLARRFLDTNRGLFSVVRRSFSWMLGVVPYKRSSQYNIFKNLRSLRMADRVLAKEPGLDEDSIYEVLRWERVNLGKSVYKLQSSLPRRQSMDRYMRSKGCMVFLFPEGEK